MIPKDHVVRRAAPARRHRRIARQDGHALRPARPGRCCGQRVPPITRPSTLWISASCWLARSVVATRLVTTIGSFIDRATVALHGGLKIGQACPGPLVGWNCFRLMQWRDIGQRRDPMPPHRTRGWIFVMAQRASHGKSKLLRDQARTGHQVPSQPVCFRMRIWTGWPIRAGSSAGICQQMLRQGRAIAVGSSLACRADRGAIGQCQLDSPSACARGRSVQSGGIQRRLHHHRDPRPASASCTSGVAEQGRLIRFARPSADDPRSHRGWSG